MADNLSLADVLKALNPYLQGMSQAAWAEDWQQTDEIARNPQKYGEANKFLGPHPTQTKVNDYFPAIMGAQLAGYEALPENLRPLLSLGMLLPEAQNLAFNSKAGLNRNSLTATAGLGAALGYLMSRFSNNKNISVGAEQVDKTTVPTLNIKF